MTISKTVLVAGRDKATIESLAALSASHFGRPPLQQHIVNGHADPLHGRTDVPDLLILDLAADWRAQLGAICERPASARPAMLVVGPATEIEAMRLAMRAGARDYLIGPVDETEFLLSLERFEQEQSRSDGPAHWTSVIGARGGVGASMVACNLAQLLSCRDRETILMDLDVQRGSLAGYLDLQPRNTFLDAIESAEDIDLLALRGYTTSNASGLRLLAAAPDQIVMANEVPAEQLATVFNLAATGADHVVADLPRHLDHVVAAGIEHADDILLVTEQSVAALQETLQILDILYREFAITESQVCIVLNRFSRNAAVSEKDVRKNLGELEIIKLPNDFRTVRNSLDIGKPLVDHNPGNAVAKALTRLGDRLTGAPRSNRSLVSSLASILRN